MGWQPGETTMCHRNCKSMYIMMGIAGLALSDR